MTYPVRHSQQHLKAACVLGPPQTKVVNVYKIVPKFTGQGLLALERQQGASPV